MTKLRFISAGGTDVGCTRQVNEDSLANLPERGLFVVADGLGGHVAGRRASEIGVTSFCHALEESPAGDPADAIRSAVRLANGEIWEAAMRNPELRGMGTTLVAMWIGDRMATLVNVGDSRIYLLRGGVLSQLTSDHSAVGEMIAQHELSEEEARSHPGRHIITRALGVVGTVEADIGSLRVGEGDSLLLCTDGISAQLEDCTIHEILSRWWHDPAKASTSLVEAANASGGRDNATALVVYLAS